MKTSLCCAPVLCLILGATTMVATSRAVNGAGPSLKDSQLLLHEKGFLKPRASPRGQAIAAAQFDVQQRVVALVRIDLAPKRSLTRLAADLDSDTDIAWSRDGARIAYLKDLDSKPALKVVNSRSGKIESVLTLPEGEYEGGIAWGNRSDEVLVAVGKRICTFDLRAQSSSWCLDFHQFNLLPGLGTFSASADDRIAVAALRLDEDTTPSEQSIWVVARGGDGYSAVQVTHGSEDSEPEWSPNGARLVFSRLGERNATESARRDTPSHLWVVSIASQEAKQVSAGQVEDRHPTWAASGDRIVFSRLDLTAVPDVCKGTLVIDAGKGFFGRLAEELIEQATCLSKNLELTYITFR